MTAEKIISPQSDTMRQRAEEIAREKAFQIPAHLESLSIEATRQMLHELQVHQIELEMQNDELRLTQGELEASRVRYFDLYDLAPVGYFTLNEQGLILEVNLTAATLLGVARSALVKQPLPLFILPEDQDTYYRHRKLLFETGAPQVCELRLVKKDAATCWVRIDATAAQGADGTTVCRATMIDITDRKRVEEALRKTEKRYRQLAEDMPALICTFLPDSTLTYVNSAYCKIFQKRPDELVGQKFLDLLPDEAIRENVRRQYMSLTPENSVLTYEHRVIVSDGIGQYHWYRWTDRAFFNDKFEVSHFQSIGQDITDRKQAEEALRENEERFRNLLQDVQSVAVQGYGPYGTTQYWNQASERLYGYSAQEAIGCNLVDLIIPPEMREGVEQAIRQMAETGVPIPASELTLMRKDGSRVEVFSSHTIVQVPGREQELFCVDIDLTERKRAEEAVQNARWFLQSVQDALSFHIAILDEDGVIVQVNMAWRNFGKQNDLQHPNSCIGQSYLDVCEQASGPDSEEALLVAQAIRDLLAGRQDRAAIEYPCHGPHEKRWFVVHITRFDDNHRWIVVAHENITDRKQIEVEIRKMNDELEQRVRGRTAQLEASNKELEAFSYTVSHDLRAPLRSIEGFSQALLEEYREKLDETGQNYLDRVCAAAKRMGMLIDDTLKLSRVARFDFQCAAVDLSRMVREITEAHQKSNPDRAVHVIIREGIIAQGDHHLLKIVLENLVGNAIKFTGKETHPRIEFGKTIKDDETAYYVRDNGAGFDMAYVNKLFGPFQRLHTAEEFAGTGIGLATVQRIISRHGGRVWAEGEIGKGAVFYFTLP